MVVNECIFYHSVSSPLWKSNTHRELFIADKYCWVHYLGLLWSRLCWQWNHEGGREKKLTGVLVVFQRCSLIEQTFTVSLTPTDSHLVFCGFDLLFGRPSLLFIFLYIQRCMWATWHCIIHWFLFWLSCVGEFPAFPQTGTRCRDDTGSEDSLQPVI